MTTARVSTPVIWKTTTTMRTPPVTTTECLVVELAGKIPPHGVM
jgi:hypothetical protein